MTRREIGVQAGIGAVAAFLLFWGLTEKYLWQDEAATAVLGERMLRFGRPLAYDGVNLVTIDHFAAEDEDESKIGQRTGDPRPAVDFYIRRGDYKVDTTWKWQPWGQFVVAAASLKLLGRSTLAARLPFALAGLATVLLLFFLVRRYCGSLWMASLAALMLALNSYWILHARQCRYYSLSSLLLMVTLLAYLRWQKGSRWGATWFVVASWCFFQVDYGTVFPVLGVLFVDALLHDWRRWWRTAAVGAVLAASMAPFVVYYEVRGRLSVQIGAWRQRFLDNLFNLNEYLVPALVLIAAAVVLAWRWKQLADGERRLVGLCLAIPVALALWVPTVAPDAFVRYVIMAAPIGAVVSAWLLVRIAGRAAPVAAVLLVATPWASLPMHSVAPPPFWYTGSHWVRSELGDLRRQLFAHQPDPNRLVVEWLQDHASPTDEILIDYEDVPLMFYLPNPIRGGIAAFRVEDDSKAPPRFAVLRRSVDFVHWPIFDREMAKYQWERVPLQAPDIVWGNNPDPVGQEEDLSHTPDLYLARRVDERAVGRFRNRGSIY